MGHHISHNTISVNLEKIAVVVNMGIPTMALFFGLLGYFISFYFHFITVFFILMTLVNFYYRHVQKRHSLLANFGFVAQLRYMFESVGPEFRQYFFLADTEEKPFNRNERAEIYKMAKGEDTTSSFGSQLLFNEDEIKLRHSMYPMDKKKIKKFQLVFGQERNIEKTYTMKSPIMISAMSYGALGENAVRSLARGAKKSGVLMNTGEGGFPKYHLMEGADLIFQMGTAKFGVRNHDGSLNEEKLKALCDHENIKMIEIKFSQGAKPGKGGLLPKEKITKEISELRGVPMGEDVVSPAYHHECSDAEKTVHFIKKVQDISELPVGIKLCLGRVEEFRELIAMMKKFHIFPDYMVIDGAEGGTGAAPKSFLDDVGVPIFKALPLVQSILKEMGVRDQLKLIASGKLINPSKQFMALSMGADAIYTARGFLLALGCIQALQCNQNTCPVGITTHEQHLQGGVDIEVKSERVANYVGSLHHDHYEIIASMGKTCIGELNEKNLYQKGVY